MWTSATQDKGLCEKKWERCWMRREDCRDTSTFVCVLERERERERGGGVNASDLRPNASTA